MRAELASRLMSKPAASASRQAGPPVTGSKARSVLFRSAFIVGKLRAFHRCDNLLRGVVERVGAEEGEAAGG